MIGIVFLILIKINHNHDELLISLSPVISSVGDVQYFLIQFTFNLNLYIITFIITMTTTEVAHRHPLLDSARTGHTATVSLQTTEQFLRAVGVAAHVGGVNS